MHIAQDPYKLPLARRSLSRGCAITIGNFDGVHQGHQTLIRRTAAKARALGLPSVVVTFHPHPSSVILGKSAPPTLMSLQDKFECFAALGADLTLVIPFNEHMAAMSAEDFISEILINCLNTREAIVGYDSTFGKGGRGDADLLRKLSGKYGYNVEQLVPVYMDGAIVSSTRIRKALIEGEVGDAARWLGRPHVVEGVVSPGMNRGGRLLGFPTANLRMDENILLPKTGVYAVFAEVGDVVGPEEVDLPPVYSASTRNYLFGVANVGNNPTFGDEVIRVETHLLDFHRDIYDRRFRVLFVRRLRDELKFAGVGELIEQIRKDAVEARRILTGFYPFQPFTDME